MSEMIPRRTVIHGDDLFSFEVAQEWSHEVEDNGTQVFWDPQSGSGTLRVSAITATTPPMVGASPAAEALNTKATIHIRDDGIAWTHYRVERENNGDPTISFWWKLARFQAPQSINLALFSFTIYAREERHAPTARQIALLGETLPSTSFVGSRGPSANVA